MSLATERTREAENAYKKIYHQRLEERATEQIDRNAVNSLIQIAQKAKVLKRKIAKRRRRQECVYLV